MSTTTLFIELLIVGLETLLWITLLIGAFFGMDWLPFLSIAFEKYTIFTSVVFLGAAYLLGIIVDEISDTLTSPWSRHIRHSLQEKNLPGMWDMIAYVFSHSQEGTAQLAYIRSRGRIMRASIFNLAFCGIFAIIYIWSRVPIANELKINLTWFIGIASVIMVVSTLYVFHRVEQNYWLRTRALYKSLVKETATQPANTTDEQPKSRKVLKP